MTVPTKSAGVQSYQVVLYNRALHPEFFPLKARRVIRHGSYEAEGWLMPGMHLFRFEMGPVCASELVTDQEKNLPDTGVVTAFLCAGEHEYEYCFEKRGVTYMTSVQTETLSENIYVGTLEELRDYGKEQNALRYEWDDEAGRCLSMLDFQRHTNEIHCQAYHCIAAGGFVLRTQTIFEHR
jgi:hypothetical protein